MAATANRTLTVNIDLSGCHQTICKVTGGTRACTVPWGVTRGRKLDLHDSVQLTSNSRDRTDAENSSVKCYAIWLNDAGHGIRSSKNDSACGPPDVTLLDGRIAEKAALLIATNDHAAAVTRRISSTRSPMSIGFDT
jgi:hypothetical protein